MNLRQKAKHYKRMYEILLKKAPKSIYVHQGEIVKLRGAKFVDMNLYLANKDFFEGRSGDDTFKASLITSFSKELIKYATYRTELIPEYAQLKCTVDLMVVKPQ